jgi:hypothetical protein
MGSLSGSFRGFPRASRLEGLGTAVLGVPSPKRSCSGQSSVATNLLVSLSVRKSCAVQKSDRAGNGHHSHASCAFYTIRQFTSFLHKPVSTFVHTHPEQLPSVHALGSGDVRPRGQEGLPHGLLSAILGTQHSNRMFTGKTFGAVVLSDISICLHHRNVMVEQNLRGL